MLAHSLRASRCGLARAATRQAAINPRRTLIVPTAIRQADLVQEMFISELKKYKPTPIKPSDADAHVQKFELPKLPPSPEESNIASDLKAYEEQQVEVEGQANTGEASAKEDDWFEDEPEEEAVAAH
ncbi:MAG: hypothetical protein M1832_003371 [Thelocarpon impressellum]|nr:MAG: hypothetical protein M1832_003371 [Thelocarpon impressellum]